MFFLSSKWQSLNLKLDCSKNRFTGHIIAGKIGFESLSQVMLHWSVPDTGKNQDSLGIGLVCILSFF